MSTRTVYDPALDLDTNDKGVAAPFETWEGDPTAYVHVLWSAEHNGWIARRPSPDQPLRAAVFNRLFNRSVRGVSHTKVIDDLRDILDAHADIDGNRVETAEHRDDPIDATATMIRHSRALSATKAQAGRDALKRAANYFRDRSEEMVDRHEVVRLLELLAIQQTRKD